MNIKQINDMTPWQRLTGGGVIEASGNSCDFKTGDWRTEMPVFIEGKCRQCLLCAPVCPDLAIPVTAGQRGEFNLDFCKGCGICARVCPFKAIEMSDSNAEARG